MHEIRETIKNDVFIVVVIVSAIIAKIFLELWVTKDWVPPFKISFVFATIFWSLTFWSIIWWLVWVATNNITVVVVAWVIWIICWVSWLIAIQDAVVKNIPKRIDALFQKTTKW